MAINQPTKVEPRVDESTPGGPSLGELLSTLIKETQTLFRQEISLAQAEMTDKAASAGKAIGAVVVGGVVAYTGVLALTAAIVLLLIHVGLTAWVAALIVGLVIGGIGAAMALSAMKALQHISPVPAETVKTIKEDIKWTRDQTK